MLPKLLENRTYLRSDSYYYPVPCYARPVWSIFNGQGIFKNILSDFSAYNKSDFYIKRSRKGELYYSTNNRLFFDIPNEFVLSRIPITDTERSYINRSIGSKNLENCLTKEDVKNASEIMEESKEDTYWKSLESMRLSNFEEMISMTIWTSLLRVILLKNYSNKFEPRIIQKACEDYMNKSSSCQYVSGNTKVEIEALREKMILPIDIFHGVYAADPDDSWIGEIDSLNTPQSEKCGAIVAKVSKYEKS